MSLKWPSVPKIIYYYYAICPTMLFVSMVSGHQCSVPGLSDNMIVSCLDRCCVRTIRVFPPWSDGHQHTEGQGSRAARLQHSTQRVRTRTRHKLLTDQPSARWSWSRGTITTYNYSVCSVYKDICRRGCACSVLQTVQKHRVYSAIYGTVHYKEPLKSFEIRVGHSPGFGLPSVAILSHCAESDVKQYSHTNHCY